MWNVILAFLRCTFYRELEHFCLQLLRHKIVTNCTIFVSGRVNGMSFVLMAYIQEYRAPKVPFGTGFDHTVSLGLGSGARWALDEPMGFPTNRPLYDYQVKGIKNMWFQDVLIYHKHTPEIDIPHTE